MWMMGCSDGGGYNMSDNFNPPRKIRPIIPKPCSSTYGNGNGNGLATSTTSHPCFNRIHGTDLFLRNHHLATEQSRKEMNAPTLASSRWNPTPEQLHTLEELYRCGTRTPSAEQIQQITAQLRMYGKIEGKNVFYWFQNHKARERQKRRRQTEKPLQHKEIDNQVEEEEEAKNWGLSTNLTTTLTQQQGRTARREEESRTTGEREFQQRRRSLENHATRQKMHLTTYSPSITLTPSTTPTTTSTTTSTTSTSTNTTTIYQMLTNNPNLTKAVTHFLRSNQEEAEDSHTLELFPLRNDENGGEKETQGVSTIATEDTNCSGYQFIEFL